MMNLLCIAFAFASSFVPGIQVSGTVAPGQFAGPAGFERRASNPPNVLVIVLDDVGLDQLAAYDAQNHYTDPAGYPYAHTPVLDSLVACGVRFTQARAMPKCSPTRAAVLTGQYPFVTGQGEIAATAFRGMDFDEANVPPAPTLLPLPTLLRSAGFDTAALGKWHLGLDPLSGGTMDDHPLEAFGFDEWRGIPRNLSGSDAPVGGGYYLFDWVEGGVRTTLQGPYATTHTVDRAADWLVNARAPFFAWVAFNGCHLPLNAANWPPPALHGFGVTPVDKKNTVLRACLEALDAELGRLLQAVPPAQQADTILVVVGDNGTEGNVLTIDPEEVRYPLGHPLYQTDDETAAYSSAPYDPLRAKQTVYETGVRVPLIVAAHPGTCAASTRVVAPGRTYDGLVDAVDLFATLLELADLPGASGVASHSFSFAPALKDPLWTGPRNWSHSHRYRPNGFLPSEMEALDYLRDDGTSLWKLVRRQNGGNPYQWEFFDLSTDPLETTDLGSLHPEYDATRIAMQSLLLSGP